MRIVASVLVLGLLVALPVAPQVYAQAGDKPSLQFSKFRVVSGSQFFELHNSGESSISMDGIQLVYYNNYDVSKATSSKMISLAGELAPGGYYLVNDSSLMMCYQAMINSTSLGFSTTSGMVQLIYFEQKVPGGEFSSQILDSLAWSRSEAGGLMHTLPPASEADAFLQKTKSGWQKYSLDPGDSCGYIETIELPEEYADFVFLSSSMPPVRRVSSSSGSGSMKVNRNVGKMAPVINEMLPNPASPQKDAEDEFIELYNPNDTVFDLSGFKLAFGSTKPKKYTFPEGTILQPKSFTAFMSGDTSISLSNTEAQVWLLDPNEKVIDQSEPYSKAKDGQAWVLDSGKWVWTLLPTPNQINAINSPISTDSKSKTAAATLGITKTNGSSDGGTSNTGAVGQLDDAAPLHPSVLAIVGLTAVGYALYEYRNDIANRIFQLRRYLRNRREVRETVQGR